MFDCDAGCVQEDQRNHEPIKGLCLDRVLEPDADPLFSLPEGLAGSLLLQLRVDVRRPLEHCMTARGSVTDRDETNGPALGSAPHVASTLV